MRKAVAIVPDMTPRPRHPHPGDIGRRVALERTRLGFSRAELARRAGMSVGYLEYLEERRTADPTLADVMRLAGALHTSVARLRGADVDLPPGRGGAAAHPVLRELDPQECRDRLSAHGVGRVAVSTAEGPAIVPVNYQVVEGVIAVRTTPDATPAAAAGATVAFEVDQLDEAMSEGWSVLATGPARLVTEPAERERLAAAVRGAPWARPERDLGAWVVIDPVRLSGRQIQAAG